MKHNDRKFAQGRGEFKVLTRNPLSLLWTLHCCGISVVRVLKSDGSDEDFTMSNNLRIVAKDLCVVHKSKAFKAGLTSLKLSRQG